MIKLASGLLAGIFAAQIIIGACAAQDQSASQFTLEIVSASNSPLGTHGLDVKVTNTSNQEMRETGCDKVGGEFKISVEYDGLPIQEKENVQAHRKRGYFDRCYNGLMPPRLKPGASRNSLVYLTQFYDMSNPGEYVVTVSKETNPSDPANSVTVRSNPFTVVVTEADAMAARAIQAKQDALGPLTLAVDESSINDGRPIVDITRKNMTDKTLFLHDAYNSIRWYDFDVRLGSTPAPETELLKQARSPGTVIPESPFGGGNITLEPGETTETNLNLADYYDMSAPGVYHVTASLVCPQCYPDQRVKSNTITITVLPAANTPSTDDSSAPE